MKKKKPHILPVCIIILFIVTAAGVLLYFRNRTQEAFLQLSELSEASKEEKDIPIPVNPYFDLSVPPILLSYRIPTFWWTAITMKSFTAIPWTGN